MFFKIFKKRNDPALKREVEQAVACFQDGFS
jgi:hypothetical protein